jgi:hypothetical protein
MVVAVIVENVLLRRTIEAVISTNAVPSRRAMKPAPIVVNFLAQN